MTTARRKIVIQFLVTNGSTAVNFLLTIILARLLSPSEVGIFSMSAVLIGFAHVFRDFGVMSFIKRQKTLTPEVLRAASGVLFVTSWTVALVMYLSADIWARFFGVEGVKDVVQVLALGFLFIPFGALPAAVLNRNFEVSKAARVSIFTVSIYFATSVTLASLGFGYMTMAWANLVNIICTGIGFNLLRPKGLPFLPSLKGWSKVFNFGTGNVLTSSLRALDTALPDILLGKMASASHVGLYSRANSTVGIMNSVLGPTINYFALPHLAKIHHADNDVGAELGRLTSYLTGVIWPALVITGMMADDIILTLYGPAWTASADAMPWLCLACGIQVTFAIVQPALTAMGRPYLSAIPIALVLAVKIAIILALFDGTLISFARAVAIAEIVSIPVYIFITKLHIGMRLNDWSKSIRNSVGVTIVVLLLAMLFDRIFGRIESSSLSLLVAALWLIPSWVLTIIYFKHPLNVEFKKDADTVKLKIIGHRPVPQPTIDFTNGKRVVIYGAVAHVPSPGPWIDQLVPKVRHNILMMRDVLLWRFGSLAKLDYHAYVTPTTINRGDEAIVQASRQTFLKCRRNLVFLNANWEDRRKFGSDKNFSDPHLIVVCGSGYIFFGRDGSMTARIQDDLKALLSTPAPVVLYGIGVNRLLDAKTTTPPPISAADEATLRLLLQRAALISVRDRNSQDVLSQYTDKPVRLIGDPAFFLSDVGRLPSEHRSTAKRACPVIGLNFPFHGPDAMQRIKMNLPAYVDMLKTLQQATQCKFLYMIHFEAERVIVKMIASTGIQLEVVSGDPDTLCRGYASLNIHIGGMLHSCILAASAGTPSVVLAYDVKHAGFFELLGLDRYCLPATPFESSRFVAAALDALGSEPKLREAIQTARLRLEKEANKFAAECTTLIDRNHIQHTQSH